MVPRDDPRFFSLLVVLFKVYCIYILYRVHLTSSRYRLRFFVAFGAVLAVPREVCLFLWARMSETLQYPGVPAARLKEEEEEEAFHIYYTHTYR